MFWTFIPIPGQTLLACLSQAIRMRGNVALALVMSWVGIVLYPSYYLSYRIDDC